VSQALIRQASQRASLRYLAGNAPAPLHTESPVKIGVEFIHALHADRAELLPGAIRLDSRKLEIVLEDMPSAYRAFRAMVALADG
jgi:D-aminopeptidase